MQQQFKQIVLIYAALMVGQILFCMITIMIVTAGTDPIPKEDNLLESLLPVFVLGAFALSYLVYRTRLQSGSELSGLANKVEHYRSTAIIRAAIMEGANLLVIVLTLVDNNLNHLIWFSLGLLAFLYFRPSTEQFIRDYALSGKEAHELRQGLRI